MLYTTTEIAEMYGGNQKNVTPYMITHTWIPNGLKYIKGKRKGFLFKKEWVDEFLENFTCVEEKTNNTKVFTVKGNVMKNKVYIVS